MIAPLSLFAFAVLLAVVIARWGHHGGEIY
jgi:hypothetical protein